MPVARPVIALLAALLLLAPVASASSRKHKRTPVAVEAEFSFTGLTEYSRDVTGTRQTCPDVDHYDIEDHVRAHIAWDTVWRVRIPANIKRVKQVILSKTQKLNGSTWSIEGKELMGEECDPPQGYSCSGVFRSVSQAPAIFHPIGHDDGFRVLMNGPGRVEADPATCDYNGGHRHVADELPEVAFERMVGGFDFRFARLLKVRNKTFTGDFNYESLPSNCQAEGDDDTCTQKAEGSGGFRYHRLRVVYKKKR